MITVVAFLLTLVLLFILFRRSFLTGYLALLAPILFVLLLQSIHLFYQYNYEPRLLSADGLIDLSDPQSARMLRMDTDMIRFALLGKLLLGLWVWFLAPVAIYVHARRRGFTSQRALQQSLWGVVLWCLGVLIYFALLAEPLPKCPGCQRILDPHFRLCPHCETPLILFCQSCGREIQRDWKSCAYCGVRLLPGGTPSLKEV